MAKRFALVSFGILCLMLSALIGFHLGSESVQAQVPGAIVGFSVDASGRHIVIDANGNVWAQGPNEGGSFGCGMLIPHYCEPASLVGNFWTGTPPVPVAPSTWGNVKDKYEGEK